MRHGRDEPWAYRRPPDVEEAAGGYVNKDHFSGRYALAQETERQGEFHFLFSVTP